ncbi:hypothetical protein LSTR_LSTR015056 [Laodelphax striatellus]|uniref:RAP domain-containing protein n=1 Tax=Laodelphax striatellus TaxID=195883 RepID=A0A482X669_LAOST|nr:hypothetical protein LSTR_LSTR015056 [Laodelphax striatellus]
MALRRFYTVTRLFNTYGRNTFQLYSVHKPHIKFEDTFNYKILQHFKRNTVYKTHTVSGNVHQTFNEQFFKSILDDKDNSNQLSLSELLDGIVVISRRYDNKVDMDLVGKIDDECFRRLKAGLSLEDTLKVLDALMSLSVRTPQMKSFFLCLQLFIKMLKTGEDITFQQFLQTLFFVSLIKDEQPVREYFYIVNRKLSRQPNLLNSLNPFELAIFCNSIYKTGTKLKDEVVLKKLVNCIDKNIKTLFSQPYLFTSVIKPLQHANYKDYKLLDKISKLLVDDKLRLDDVDLIGSIYLLKLYANALYEDEKIILFLADSVLKSLQNSDDNNEVVRIKDISVILRAFCQYGFDSLKQRVIDHLIPKIDKLFETETHHKRLKYCIEILLWLNVLGICPRKTMEGFLSPRNLERGRRDGKLKHHSRVNLLLTILSIEHPDILVNRNVQHLKEDVVPNDIAIHLSHPELNKVQEAVKFLAACEIGHIKSFQCTYLVPNLYIKGIVIETSRSSIAVELLGERACLHATDIPHGFMNLKLRLLSKMNYSVILINKEDIKGKQEDLMAKIEDEIRRIDNLQD